MPAIRLTGQFDAVDVEGVAGLEEPEVEGPHRAHHEGDTLVVEGTGEEGGTSSVTSASTGAGVRVTVSIGGSQAPVTIRVPPETDVDAELAAATVVVRELAGAVRLQLKAGSVVLDRCTGGGHVRCRAGKVVVDRASLDAAPLAINVDVGSVEVTPA